ncbi:glycosyltransferase family 2 protein [Candidatus Bathyarchaeota archaeon]|nr:MAG: glycosyltransferase family 2 protein [Candidatus Bathyarchaeota archaeon]
MGKDKPFIVACIPAYNEEESIAKVLVKTMKYVDKVIVCDDGSTDLTSEIAKTMGAEVIRHERNLGYGAALASLFREARNMNVDVMVTLDADGQHDPDDIPKLVKPILDGEADIVIGSRFLTKDDSANIPAYRRLGIKAITKMTRMFAYTKITDAQSGFRAYGRKAIAVIQPSEYGMGASTEILQKASRHGLKVKELPIKTVYDERSSTHNPVRHGIEVISSIIKFASIRHPMLFYGLPGLLAILIAVTFWVWALQIFSTTRQLVTNIALIAIGASIIGLVLLTTAMILWVLISLLEGGRLH